MATMLKVKAKWTGFTGAPGYSNFFFRDFSSTEPTDTEADLAADRIEAFFSAVKEFFPPTLQIAVQSDADVIEETTGELVTSLNAGTRVPVTGTGAAVGYSAASGIVVTWRTAGVRNGRRVRGRTFLVPCVPVAYAADGTLATGTITTVSTAATALRNAAGTPDLGVWARPTGPGATDGSWHAVNAHTVPDLAAVLRSRRD